MEKIILIGGGGHAKGIIDSIRQSKQYEIVGIVERPGKVNSIVYDTKIIGEDRELKNFYNQGIKFAFLTLGSIGDYGLREKLYYFAKEIGYTFPVIVDKSAIVSPSVSIGEGTFIGKGSIINSDAKIGRNCILNSACVIEHDCEINDFVHIAPSAALSGNVHVGKGTHIGTNATVIQNIKIGSNTIVGAGSVVIKEIPNNVKVYGNPCKVVSNNL